MSKNLRPFLLFVAALAILSQISPMLGIVDDAWITYAYARNLAHGQGIAFNPGERVEGCTAFLHMALLAPFSWLTARLDLVAVALNIVAWAGVVALLWSFIRKFSGPRVGVLGLFLTAFALLGLSGAAWTFSGMEMPLVALAWLAAVAVHLREREKNTVPWASALLTVAAGLLRPDGILVAPTLAISTWWADRGKRDWKNAGIYCALVIGLFGGYWLWRWSYFGYFLPNTFYAKVTTVSLSLTLSGVRYVVRWLFGMVVPCFGLLAFIAARREAPAPRWVKLMLALVATSLGYCLLVGGDFFSFHRFLLPSYAPMLLATWWCGVAWRRKRRRRATAPERPRPVKIAIAAALFIVCQFVYFIGRVPPQGLVHEFIVQNTQDWQRIAAMLPADTPPDAVIATVPIGALGYFSHRYILDLVGLTDVHIAHAPAPTGVGITGHEKYDIDYVMQRAPQLILSWPGLMPAGVDGLQKWIMSNIGAEAQKNLLSDPRTAREYALVWMRLDERLPIRRGGAERWLDLQRGRWSGETYAKGVIGLLRKDLLGSPAWAAFTPLDETDAAWIWRVFTARSNEELFQKIAEMRRGGPPAGPGGQRPGADEVDAIIDHLAGQR